MSNTKDIIRDIARKWDLKPTQEELDLLAESFVVQKYQHRKVVVKQGEVCNFFYYIHKGLIRQYTISDGQEVTVNVRHEGFFVSCLTSFFSKMPSDTVMQTLEPTVLYAISYDTLFNIIGTNPSISRFFLLAIVQTIEAMERSMAIMRMPLAQDRYQTLMDAAPEIVRRTPVKHLASLLLMRNETLSRVRAQCPDDIVWSAYTERERQLAEERS